MNEKLYEQLMAYFDGESEPNERARLEEIIRSSPECQELLNGWRQRRTALQVLKKTQDGPDYFVNQVMNQIESIEEPPAVEKVPLPDFVRWLLPSLGYALSAILVFFTFSVKHPASVNAETILLSEMPHEAHGVFVKSGSDVSQMFSTEEM